MGQGSPVKPTPMPITYRCLTIITSLVMITSCHRQEQIKISGKTMGTTWSLCSRQATEGTRQLIQSHLDQREAVLSHWRQNSAISRFNDSRSMDWQPVPPELAQIVKIARDIASLCRVAPSKASAFTASGGGTARAARSWRAAAPGRPCRWR